MSTTTTIQHRAGDENAPITLEATKIDNIERPSLTTALVRYKDGTANCIDIGLDGWRRLGPWIAENGIGHKGAFASTFVVRDCMSGVPYQLEYGTIKSIEWSPGPLAKVNRTATVYLKNGEALRFNLYLRDADHVVNWMLANGAIHSQAHPDRRVLREPTIDENEPWWIVELRKYSGGGESTDDARRAAKVALDTLASRNDRRALYDGPVGTTLAEKPAGDGGVEIPRFADQQSTLDRRRRGTRELYTGPERRKGGES